MFNETEYETLESLVEGESNDWNEFSDYSERARPRGLFRPRPLPTPPQGNATARAPQAGYATKAELEATANRLDGRIATNSKAIAQLNGRVTALGASHTQLGARFGKEVSERKAATDKLNQQFENMKMAVMLTPLISTPSSKEITDPSDSNKKIKVLVEDNDSFKMILPMMMLSGGFGGSGAGGSSGNDMMLPLMMVFALGKNNS